MHLWSRLLRYMGLGVLLAVLAIGPFFRGLFFWTELLAAITLVSLGFCLWLVGRRLGGLPSGILGGVAGWALLALLGCYLLQFFWAVYPRGNIDWTLRVAAGWFAYVMLRAEAGPALRRWVSWVFVLSAAGVGFLGFLEFTGYFLKDPSTAEALSLVGLSSRMFTSFQYPNTAAAYFLAAVFAAAGLALDETRPWKLLVSGGLISFLSLSFFFTVSRGAVVVLPFGLILFFLGLDRDKRWPALLLLLTAWVPVVAALKGVGANSEIKNYVSAFRWIGAVAVGGAVGGLVLAYFLRLKMRWQGAVVGGALVLGLAGLLALRPAGGLMPKQATRLFDMNFRTVSVALRLVYYQDALRIIADAPQGRGGWGWDRSYRQYQEFNYTARETHNHYAQTSVEAGVPGLLALLTALGAALWSAWQNRRGAPLLWTLVTGGALIAGHSVMDFNLSFGAAWLLLWSLLAAGGSPVTASRWEFPAKWGSLAAGIGATVLAGLLFAGSRYLDHAEHLAEHKQSEAVTAARQAFRYDPWNSQALLVVGDAPSLNRAVQLDPHHPKAHWDLAILLELQKDWQGALREANGALNAQPMLSIHYSKVASLAGTAMVDALHHGKKEEAHRHAQDLVALGAAFTHRKAAAEDFQHLWSASKLEMAPDFQLRYGQALYLIGDHAVAEPLLTQAAKSGLLGSEADIWLYAMYERLGNKAAMATLERKPWVRFRNVNPVYKALQTW